jgi:HKD family nuclease
MPLFLQDPHVSPSSLLLDELEKHFKDANVINCAFAFATADGISLLFDQAEVKESLKRAKTHLIIGMDAITDTKAIERLSALCAEFKNLSVQIFLRSGGIFHPKVSWVKKGKSGVIIVGSGNLTKGGLKNNFEAFYVIDATPQTMATMENNWAKFLADNEANFFSLDTEEVKKAAAKNVKLNSLIKEFRKKTSRKKAGDVIPQKGAVVFIEELTKGRGGKQRDVGKWAGENYFGKDKKLFLMHINNRGEREPEEARKISCKESVNFAIDLAASKGLAPVNQRMPIAVFIRISPQDFFYHILTVDSKGYETVSKYLGRVVKAVSKGKARRLNEELPVKKLREIWPDAPFWRLKNEVSELF